AYVLGQSLTDAGRSMPYLGQFLDERAYGADGVLFRGTGPLLIGRLGRALLTTAALPGSTLLLFVVLGLLRETRRRGDAGTRRHEDTERGRSSGLRVSPSPCPPVPPSPRLRVPPSPCLPVAPSGFVLVQWLLQFAFIAAVSARVFERYYLLLLA